MTRDHHTRLTARGSVSMPLVIPPVVNEDDGLTHLVELVLVVPDVLLLLGGRGLDVQVVPRPREDLPPWDHGGCSSPHFTLVCHAVTELKQENCKILICFEVEEKTKTRRLTQSLVGLSRVPRNAGKRDLTQPFNIVQCRLNLIARHTQELKCIKHRSLIPLGSGLVSPRVLCKDSWNARHWIPNLLSN